MYTVKRRKTTGVQTGCSTANLKGQSTQCGSVKGSYERNEKNGNFISYENLLEKLLVGQIFHLVTSKRRRAYRAKSNLHRLLIRNERV